MSSEQPRVFISYAREDVDHARRLFDSLAKAGAAPWLDIENLLPGQAWESVIEKTLKQSDYVILLLSKRSLNKRGFIQKELKYVLELLEEVPESQIFLIPARLDDCQPEQRTLQKLNWVDLFPSYETGFDRILRVIRPEAFVRTGGLSVSFVADELDLAQAGWGVIYAADVSPEVREALSPLLQLRKAQAGAADQRRFKEFSGEAAYSHGQSARIFLERRGVGPGIPDPNLVPSYLLLVGSPQQIPWSVQHDLGVQYRVGRLAFDTPEEYARYGQNVVDAESRPSVRRATFFSVTHDQDRATNLSLMQLTRPLQESLVHQIPDFELESVTEQLANKQALGRILADSQGRSLLFVVAHGLRFRPDNPSREQDQGAIVCADWPGFGKIDSSQYFSAADLETSADLRGLVVWLFVDFGVGTPNEDDGSLDAPTSTGPAAISPLPMRLLGRKNGALCVIGTVGRSFFTVFSWPRVGPQVQTFVSATRGLLEGQRVASALRPFSSMYTELATEYLQNLKNEEIDRAGFRELVWGAMTTARNQVLLGDPAAVLRVKAR